MEPTRARFGGTNEEQIGAMLEVRHFADSLASRNAAATRCGHGHVGSEIATREFGGDLILPVRIASDAEWRRQAWRSARPIAKRPASGDAGGDEMALIEKVDDVELVRPRAVATFRRDFNEH